MSKVIYRTGYNNILFALVREGGEAVSLGEVYEAHNGGEYELVGGDAPHKPSSSGKVYVKSGDGTCQFFPSVFGLKYMPVTDDLTFTN